MSQDDIATCLQRWRSDRDEAAARQLIDGLYPLVIRIVQNHLPRGMEPEDLAQDVFAQFFRTLERYDASRPLENWLSRLTLNVCLNALRSRKRRPEWRWTDLGEEEQAVAESLLREDEPEAEHGEEGRKLLGKLLETLPAKDRMVVTLLHLEEKPVSEVARLTGWSPAAIKVRAFRARAALRRQLEAWEQEKRGADL